MLLIFPTTIYNIYNMPKTAPDYSSGLAELRQLFQRQYVSERDLQALLRRHHLVRPHRSDLKISFASLRNFCASLRLRRLIRRRAQLNRAFIQRCQAKGYSVEGHPLDAQQVEAVVACEDLELTLAPAGSGKTAALLGKVFYLVKELHIPVNQILLIAFNRKVVTELQDRAGLDQLKIKTFHSLGNAIIKRHRSDNNLGRTIITEQAAKTFLRRQLRNLCQDPDYARQYHDYLLLYHSTPIDLSELHDNQQRIEFNKLFLRKTLQAVTTDKANYADTQPRAATPTAPTARGELVRSKEEQIIANWLWLNQISYTYEQQYPHTQLKYRPDFTINQFGTPIYYEHFALRRDGTSPFPGYPDQVKWKRQLHRDHDTLLIETYSYEWQEGTLLQHLERRLERAGASVVRRDEADIAALLNSDTKYRADIESFENLLYTIINLQKSAGLDLSALQRRISRLKNPYVRRRARLWFELYRPLYEAYQQHLKSTSHYDFTDMINEATDLANQLPRGTFPYRYILVDEAQDLSRSRCDLLRAVLEHCPDDAKLFAVGDDWQSINRFAGSDCTLLDQFDRYFNRTCYRSLIERVYRFGDPVSKISSKFIQKNPHQTHKQVQPLKGKYTSLAIRLNQEKPKFGDPTAPPPDYQLIDGELHRLYDELGEKLYGKSIQIISRYNRDIERIFGRASATYQRARIIRSENDSHEIEWQLDPKLLNSQSRRSAADAPDSLDPLKLSFCSMHKAKGMTRDIVFVINVNAGTQGIPATRGDDPLVALLLARPDDFPFSEERRLFYVAITRAKELTVVCADAWQASPFLYELGADLKHSDVRICPKCRSGILVERRNHHRGSLFYACSNWTSGCDYTEN